MGKFLKYFLLFSVFGMFILLKKRGGVDISFACDGVDTCKNMKLMM